MCTWAGTTRRSRPSTEAIQVRRGLARDFAFFPAVHRDLYESYQELAFLYRTMGKAEEASRTFRTARDLFANLSQVTAEDRYLQAQVLALCAASDREQARNAKDPAQARESEAEADRNAQQSIASLKRAVEMGFNHHARLRTDTDLDAIRDRPDFQTLYADLVARNPAGPSRPI